MATPKTLKRRGAAARVMFFALAVGLVLPLGTSAADARAGGGFSFGSRGSRTFSMPAPTPTAPRWSQQIGRSDTSSLRYGMGSRPRFGFGTGLAAGLFGAGLLGMLTGNGFFGGIFGLFSFIGMLFQLALIGGLIWLGLRMFRSRMGGPAFAGLGSGAGPRTGYGGLGAGPMRARASGPVAVGPQDYAAFERALVEIQNAYGREDPNALARLVTPEMLRNFVEEIEANRRRGLRNEIADPKLLQGDLAEAWSEGGRDYATVAMRFGLRDVMVERGSGRLVSGDPNRPTEATEAWTFRRDGGGPWLLSAIQQAG